MNVSVMMSSGDIDEWEGVHDALIDTDLGGSLTVLGPAMETEDGRVSQVLARYAPGMWMKVEYIDVED